MIFPSHPEALQRSKLCRQHDSWHQSSSMLSLAQRKVIMSSYNIMFITIRWKFMRQSVVQPPLSKCYPHHFQKLLILFPVHHSASELVSVYLLHSWTSRPGSGAVHFSWKIFQPGAQDKLNNWVISLEIQLQNSASPHLDYFGMLNTFPQLWFAFSLPHLSTNVLPLDFFFFLSRLFFPRHAFPFPFTPCTLLPSLPPPHFSFCWVTHLCP